jgi:hypothetical protein
MGRLSVFDSWISRQRYFAAILTAVFFVVVWTTTFPLNMRFIGQGLDPSWAAALTEARKLNLEFGTQVLFTGGPLSHLYTNQFGSASIYETIFSALVFTGFFSLFFSTAISRSNRNLLGGLLVIAPFWLSLLKDPVFVGAPFCASLILTTSAGTRRSVLLVLGAAAAALATLAKFSVFAMAIGGFLFADIAALSSRRAPVSLISYVVILYAIFHMASPHGASFMDYVTGSFEVAAGFAEGMSLTGSADELAVAMVVATGIISLMAAIELRCVRHDGRPRLLLRAESRSLPSMSSSASRWVLCDTMGTPCMPGTGLL